MGNTSNNQIIFKGISFVFGVFLLAMCYNLFLLPNNLVVGGMSGLAIIFQNLLNWDATIFIYISSIGLLFVSFIFLGKSTTTNTIVGSILYPIMVSITAPIATFILKYLVLDEYLLVVLLAALSFGVSNGIIYKFGYTTGGGDVIMQLLSKYAKISLSKANFIYCFIIILLSGYAFGLSMVIYAVVILIISNIIIDKIIVGISNSKVFFINTHETKKVKKMILEDFQSGLTILPTKSEILHKKSEVLMVVIPNRSYYAFKNRVLEIDPQAFFIINDCYEVNGGKRKSNVPFL